MKLVTFNLRMENPDDGPHRFLNRRAAIIGRIRTEAPDILGFQEALPEMYDYLREHLPEYAFVGHGRSETYLGEANPIAFRPDRFVLKSCSTRWLSPTPEVPGSCFPEDQSICPRIFVTAELYDWQTDSVFRVVNTHLDHEGPIARRRALELIARQIPDDLPTVLMGDFNCPPTDDALELLRERFLDQTQGLGHTFHCFEGYYTWKTDKIDYIFTTKEFRRSASGLWKNQGVCLSDHYPVCFEGGLVQAVRCHWEHRGEDTVLWAVDYPGAFARGAGLREAMEKLPKDLQDWAAWTGGAAPEFCDVQIIGETESGLDVRDADSDVLMEAEKTPLQWDEYERLRNMALDSAEAFLALYRSMPDPDRSENPVRRTFYGDVPRTAREMYEHTKNVNAYYFGEIGVEADNDGDIVRCRRRGFEALEKQPDFLKNPIFEGSWDESWTLRKLLRRFIWHDRIHARAMERMCRRTFGPVRRADGAASADQVG